MRGQVGHQRALYSESLRYHKVHDAFVSPDSGGRPVVPTEGCRGAVVVIRDPADVAVSLSHFFSWDLERCVAFLLNEEAALCRSRKRGGQQVRQFMGSWANHVGSWVDQREIPVLVLRYEDLLRAPEREFQRLAAFLELPADSDLIAAAALNTRFDKLRAKEDEEGGFQERPPGCERFFRSGCSGEGREQLSAEQLVRLQTAFAPTLAAHGYAVHGPAAHRSPSTPLVR